MFNHFTHLVVPIAFGGIGTVFGFAPVFLSCSAVLLGGSWYGQFIERRTARHGKP